MQTKPPPGISDGDASPVRTSNATVSAETRFSHASSTTAASSVPPNPQALRSPRRSQRHRRPPSPQPPLSLTTNTIPSGNVVTPDPQHAAQHAPEPPSQQQPLRPTKRASAWTQAESSRGSARRSDIPTVAVVPGSPANTRSSVAPGASANKHLENRPPDDTKRNGAASLAPIASFTPPVTILSASATRRSPSSPSTTSAPWPTPTPPAAHLQASSTGNAAAPGTIYNSMSLDDSGGSNGIGGSGMAYRLSSGISDGPASRGIAPTYPRSVVANDIMGRPPGGGPVRSILRRRLRARSPWSITCLSLSVALAGALLLSLIVRSLLTRQLDPKGCRMSYMRPSYAHLREFDTEHTRFASKYSLYLYREQGVDDEAKLKGIPVLFIPGNAGSYKQVRPIAAAAANQFHDVVRHDAVALRAGARSLDFFTVDFNEDITAFHGQTLLDQAEYLNEAIRYILSLYLDPRLSVRDADLPDPTSVIVLGHSMGGVVARTMLIMPNYQANSINTIITLSAPHARPPVTFDSEIVKIYDNINDYWRRAYSQQWANNNPLWHVTLISIAGGGPDTVVPSDYASLESLVPETHGFTVFTTTIPHVWTSADHQAILWCDQFRKVISRALYDVVDVHRATQTKPRAERMRVFKKHLLTGMEAFAEKDMPSKEPTTLLTLEDKPNDIIPPGERLILRSLGTWPRPKAYILPIPSASTGPLAGKRFTLLSDQHLDDPGDSSGLEVLFCSVFPLQSGPSGVLPVKIDLTSESAKSIRFACKNAAIDAITLPASHSFSRHPFSVDEHQSSTFSYLQYDIEHISDHQFVVVIDKATIPTAGFVMAEFTDKSKFQRTLDISLRRLLAFGVKFDLPTDRPLVTEMKIPAMQSSLLAYNLEIGSQACAEGTELLTPLVRQYLDEPFESKYYVNARQESVSIHGVAPFMPPPLVPRPPGKEGLGLQFWTDPTCNSNIQVQLTVDAMGSLGKLYMRYRTVFAAFPVLIVALILQKQFRIYDESGVFVPFSESLDLCLRQSIPVILGFLTLLSLSAGAPHTAQGSYWNWRNSTEVLNFQKNELLVGTEDPFYWFLIPLIGLICVGVCTAFNYACLALTSILGAIVSLAFTRPGWVRHKDRLQVSQHTANGTKQQLQQQEDEEEQQQQQQRQQQEQLQQPYLSSAFLQSTPRKRVVTTAVLLFLVSTVVPYQFAYVVACLVQLGTTVRAQRISSKLRSTAALNFYNYVHSILILMLWILPINIPTLAVWVRNLAVHWLTPFSSHHNVISIMPFIVLVETLTTGRMVPRVTTRLRYITGFLLIGVAMCSAVYGVSYAYMIHYLVNIVVAWLVVVHSTGEPDLWSPSVLSALFEDEMTDGKLEKAP